MVSDWSRSRSSRSAVSADASEIADETAEHETSRTKLGACSRNLISRAQYFSYMHLGHVRLENPISVSALRFLYFVRRNATRRDIFDMLFNRIVVFHSLDSPAGEM